MGNAALVVSALEANVSLRRRAANQHFGPAANAAADLPEQIPPWHAAQGRCRVCKRLIQFARRRDRHSVSLATLAADLKTVWDAPSTDARLKKRIVRTVIHEVIADIDPEAAEIVLLRPLNVEMLLARNLFCLPIDFIVDLTSMPIRHRLIENLLTGSGSARHNLLQLS